MVTVDLTNEQANALAAVGRARQIVFPDGVPMPLDRPLQEALAAVGAAVRVCQVCKDPDCGGCA